MPDPSSRRNAPDARRALSRRLFLGATGAGALGLVAGALTGCAPPTAVPATLSPMPTPPNPSSSPDIPPTAGRRLVWSQEFDGSASTPIDTAVWMLADSGSGSGNNELQAYTPRPANVALDGDGSLRIRALVENHTDPQGRAREYTSGRLETEQLFRYGRIEARIRVPVGLGLWPAFWMIGDFVDGREWPAVGEIDIMEYVNDMTTLHANGWGDTDIGTTWSFTGRLPVDPGFAQNWHVYSVEWTSESLVFAVDDDPFHSIDRAGLQPGQVWRFDQPQAILVNLAVGGDFPGAVGDDSVFPAEMHVDFIRVYDSELFARG